MSDTGRGERALRDDPADRPLSVSFTFAGAFGALTSFCMAGIVALARSGLDTSTWALWLAPLVFTTAAFSPFLLTQHGRLRLEAWPALWPLLVLALWLSPIAGLVGPGALAIAYPLLASLGVARALPTLRRLRPAEWTLLAVGPPLLALYLFSQVHNVPFAHVLAPEEALLGNLNLDTSLHTTISHMIARFGLSSTAADGLVPLHYHVGSHAWLAGFSRLAGVHPTLAYPLGQLCVAVPMLYLALYLATLALTRESGKAALHMLLATALVWLFDRIGWASYYISESYTFGLALLLLGLPLLIDRIERPRRGAWPDALRTGALLAIVFCASAMKVSVGFVFAAALAWALLRLEGFSWKGARQLALLGAVGLAALYLFVARTSLPLAEAFSPFDFYLRTSFGGFLAAERAHSSLLLPVAYVLLSLRWLRARPDGAPSEPPALVVEMVAVTTLVAHLPGLVLAMWSGTGWWFQNVPQWFVIPLLIAGFARALEGALPPRVPLLAASVALTLMALGPLRELPQRYGYIATRIVRLVDEFDGQRRLPRGASIFGAMRESLARHGTLYEPGVAASVRETPLARLARWIEAAAAREEGASVAVFVPPSNTEFWQLGLRHLAAYPDWLCLFRPFWIPMLSGVPMLVGLAPGCQDLDRDVGYGLVVYGPDSHARPLGAAKLCQHARIRAIEVVLILRSLENPSDNRRLDCRSGSQGYGTISAPP